MVSKNLSLEHKVLAPVKKHEKPPLLLVLHGYGSDENDLFSMAPMLNQQFLVVSARAPLSIGFGGFAWYEINFSNDGVKTSNTSQAKEAMEMVRKFIVEVHEAYGTDSEQVSLLGFSQGAILSYGLSFNYPKEFNSIIALSGYIMADLLPKQYDLAAVRALAIFASHGVQDEVIPIDWARKAAAFLEKMKCDFSFKEYAMGHGVNQNCFEDLQRWLSKQQVI